MSVGDRSVKSLAKKDLYRLCCNLMLDLGMAAQYDPRMKDLKSVEIQHIKVGPGNFKTRPLTEDEIREMVDRYSRDVQSMTTTTRIE